MQRVIPPANARLGSHAALAWYVLPIALIVWSLLGCDARHSQTGVETSPTPQAQAQPRLVVLAPALGEMCQDLGLEDQIVGKHDWDMALGASIPAVGTHDDPDLEALLRVEPTHILAQRLSDPGPTPAQRFAQEHGWDYWDFPLLTLDDIAIALDEIHQRLRPRPGTAFDPERPGSIDPTPTLSAELPSARLADAWRDRGPSARQAGRVLLLAQTDPPGAMGPGSFHHQLLERLGAEPALATGGPWQELDHEDLIRLAPDAIIVFSPRPADDRGVGAPPEPDALAALGPLAHLDLPAVRSGRIAVIDDPLGLLPASSLARVADAIGRLFERWSGPTSEAQPANPSP